MGDDIQAIKPDNGDWRHLVINKADREGVYSTEKELESPALSLSLVRMAGNLPS
jgi:putative protein kinase ArgK-like GTPase of G3E family